MGLRGSEAPVGPKEKTSKEAVEDLLPGEGLLHQASSVKCPLGTTAKAVSTALQSPLQGCSDPDLLKSWVPQNTGRLENSLSAGRTLDLFSYSYIFTRKAHTTQGKGRNPTPQALWHSGPLCPLSSPMHYRAVISSHRLVPTLRALQPGNSWGSLVAGYGLSFPVRGRTYPW